MQCQSSTPPPQCSSVKTPPAPPCAFLKQIVVSQVSLSDSDVEMAVPAKAEQGPDQFDAAFVGDEGPHDARGAVTDSDAEPAGVTDSDCEPAAARAASSRGSAVPNASAAQATSAVAGASSAPKASGARCLELFSGKGNLSRALRAVGMATQEFDVLRNAAENITDPTVVSKLQFDITEMDYIHFGIPCNSFSTARWPKLRNKDHPTGIPGLVGKRKRALDLGEKILKNSCNLIEKACSAGKFISIENPAGSLMWKHPRLRRLASRFSFDFVRLDCPATALPPTPLTSLADLWERSTPHPRHNCLSPRGLLPLW